MSAATAFYELKAEKPKGEIDFKELEGKVVLISNTASKCGFTPQYKGLEELYKKYKDQGFVILGFPSTSFNQEHAKDDDVSSFCELNYGVTFPLAKVSEVNGSNENEVFHYLKSQKAGLLGMTRIKWNFEKFLIDKKGNVVSRYASTTKPESLAPEIEKLLAA